MGGSIYVCVRVGKVIENIKYTFISAKASCPVTCIIMHWLHIVLASYSSDPY